MKLNNEGGGEAITNQEFLEMATQVLRETAHLERSEAHSHARLLLDGATGVRYSHLIAPKDIIEAQTLERLQFWLSNAARGRPIPYILGKAPFFGLEWELDERVLIPRPETELLIETTLARLESRARRAPKIADLGTGSGIIAVTLQHKRPDARVFALDISSGALEIAARNAQKHGAAVEFVRGEGDWLAPLRIFAPFDALVSNPPYIESRAIETLEIGVREFEPRIALDGGEDGLQPYREIAAGAADLLCEDGFVALEMGATQFGAIRAIFEDKGWKVESPRRDLAGIERVLLAQIPV